LATALAAAPLFAGLPSHALQVLAGRAFDKDFDRGEIVFQKGEPGTAMYLVRSGLLKVYDSSPDGVELVLTTVPPGATVGELALADGGERSASVAAVHPTRALVLRRDDFLHVLREEGALAEPLLRYLAASLRRVTDFAADLVFLDLSARVAKLLTRLAEETGQAVRPGMRLRPLTQSELAGMVGASRQSTNKVLRDFVQAGWVEQDGRQLRLLRPDLLQERAFHLD
jgi:CRP-like cAMP-binding protein